MQTSKTVQMFAQSAVTNWTSRLKAAHPKRKTTNGKHVSNGGAAERVFGAVGFSARTIPSSCARLPDLTCDPR
jgi:hypothetical protein